MISKRIRRINFFAGPGASKSTNAALLFAKLKTNTVNDAPLKVELIQEYIKSWAYQGRKVRSWDQCYTFMKQLRREYIPLSNGVDIIVSDSPLFLNCAYAQKYQTPGWEQLFQIAEKFETEYPSLNIFVVRGDRKYVASGRYETEDQAKAMDEEIRQMLIANGVSFYSVSYADNDKMYFLAMQNIRNIALPTSEVEGFGFQS